MIGGDLNAEEQELSCTSDLRRAGWADWGREATCITAATKVPRRIDQAWMSPELQARLLDVQLSWAMGLKTHAWQQGSFRSGPADTFPQWVPGDAGPEEGEAGFSDAEFWALFAGRAAAWEQCRQQRDVDGLWQLLEATLVECHGLRSEGFKKPAAVTKVGSEEPRRNPFTGEALSEEHVLASLRKRRVQQWLSLFGRPECAEQLRQLKAAIAEDSDPKWSALVASDPQATELEALVLECRAIEDEVRLRSKATRRAGWRQWVLAQTSGGMRALFRWIRQGPAGLQSTGVVVREDGLYAGQKALLAASEEAWWPIWRNEEEPNWARVNPPRATAGWRPQRFSGRELHNLIWVISVAKAAGHDGWQTRRMRQWPVAVWHLIAILFETVEAVGRWPTALRGGVVCLLPKAGRQATTTTPLEARPVVLLPMLYRMWAHKRGHEMAAWLTANRMEGLEDPSRSAEDYGTLLAADLERALAEDEAMLAVCVDQSKAYDNMKLDLLDFLLAGSGVPQEVRRPIMDMAKAPRRLKVLNAVGEWQLPTSGMLPGCPTATRIQSLVLERWRRGVRTGCPSAMLRCWVDDSTAAGRGETGGLAVWIGATRGFEDLEQGDGAKVNRSKSGIICSHARLQRLVEQATALRAKSSYGLVVGSGPEEPPGWEAQWRHCLGAPTRMAFRWRCTGAEAGELAGEAAREATIAAVAASAAREAVEEAAAADPALFAEQPCGAARLPQSRAELVRRAEEAAAVAAEEAGRAAGRAAAAAEAAVDRRVLATVASVWLAFDGNPPDGDVQAVLAGGRGCWLPTTGADADLLARARARVTADSDEERWGRRPMLQLPVVPALKDLGVAQGLGVEAKQLQAERARMAFARMELVARLGLPRSYLGRLVGASALTAGMYGAACHVYDSDHLPSLRNWVMHALYRGSRFAQVRLFMQLVLPCPQADPWRVALRKGWHACNVIRQEWGEELFWRVWAGTTKDGPLLSFKRLLLQLPAELVPAQLPQSSLEQVYRAAGPAWLKKCEAWPLLDKALRAYDLGWVAARRPNLHEAAKIDVELARMVAQQLPAHGLREAFQAVMIGDMVVRHQTRHWQGHDGGCLCQTGQETVEHVFWQCPRYAQHRWGGARCSQAASSLRPQCQRVLGTPFVLKELADWKAAFRPSVWAKPPWHASEIFADGSGRNPKDPQVRVVGWAFCARLLGGWVSAAGWLEPGATVTAGEATAVARALEVLLPGGLIVTDCQAVWKMWLRIRRSPRTVSRGVSHPCWLLLAEALAQHPSARCEWMRSHRSAEEARQAGYPAAWHEGNAKADEVAKKVAIACDVPGAVLAAYRRHKEAAEQVAGTIAAIQLARLQARTRTAEGGAVKERRRRQPALPRRLRPQVGKRKRLSAQAADERRAGGSGGVAAGVGESVLPPCGRLGQAKECELPSRQDAMEIVFRSQAPAEGLHDLRPVGPWPLPGTVPSRNGRVPWTWACLRCGRSAGDSSRAKELARKPCGGAEWQLAAAKHVLELDGTLWRCSRCLLQVRPQHSAQTERQACPVGECSTGGGRWLPGEAGLRELFGRLRAFRHFCTPDGEEDEPLAQRSRNGATIAEDSAFGTVLLAHAAAGASDIAFAAHAAAGSSDIAFATHAAAGSSDSAFAAHAAAGSSDFAFGVHVATGSSDIAFAAHAAAGASDIASAVHAAAGSSDIAFAAHAAAGSSDSAFAAHAAAASSDIAFVAHAAASSAHAAAGGSDIAFAAHAAAGSPDIAFVAHAAASSAHAAAGSSDIAFDAHAATGSSDIACAAHAAAASSDIAIAAHACGGSYARSSAAHAAAAGSSESAFGAHAAAGSRERAFASHAAAGSSERLNPLAEAEGPSARRALKLRGEAAGSAGGGQPTAAVAGGAAEVMHGVVEQTICPSPLARLQPYMGHTIAFVGRSLWCLNCFEVPRSAHRSWRHGRCGGVRPSSAMPPALRDSIVRQPAACPGLQAGTRARWAVLAGDLGLHLGVWVVGHGQASAPAPCGELWPPHPALCVPRVGYAKGVWI